MAAVSETPSPVFLIDHKFSCLDAIRGIAALLVMMYHCHFLFGTHFFPHSYLAVDIFFCLSGFVLSYAYQRKLDTGLSTFQFLKIRLIRLYPLYVAALIIGFSYSLYGARHDGAAGLVRNSIFLLPSLLLLPSPFLNLNPQTDAFPFDFPAWSLFYELVANVAHAVFIRKRSTQTLLLSVAFVAVILFSLVLKKGSVNYGVHTTDLVSTTCRVLFSYLLGILAFRFWTANQNRWTISFLWPITLVLAAFLCPITTRYNAIYEIITISVILPSAIVLASFATIPRFANIVSGTLATASYALYVLHIPIATYYASVLKFLDQSGRVPHTPLAGIIFLVFIMTVAVCADTFVDIPVRHWLKVKLRASSNS